MAISKINSSSINLADTYAFTGTVSGAGKVLQVVTNTHTTRFSTSSTSYVAATGYTIAITPSATSSKIFVCISAMADSGASGRINYMTIYRGSTNLGQSSDGLASTHAVGTRIYTPVTLSELDSPSTTSEITYQVYIKAYDGAVVFNDQESEAQLTAFEIAG